MKAILLAAGYATRLYPLTENRPKMLLPVGGRPILDWIADKVDQVEEVDELHVVTNSRFAAALQAWASVRDGRLAATVHDDATSSNADRLGAIGDVRLVVDRAGLRGDDLLVVAGDNLFDFDLRDYVSSWRSQGVVSAVALYDCGSLELARQYGVVAVDSDGRVTEFVEKPAEPPSTLVAIATYIYHRDHVGLVDRYLDEGGSPDAPGSFIAWLCSRQVVYGYRFVGAWFDIGDREQLLAADNELRVRAGLPPREAYDPGPAQG